MSEKDRARIHRAIDKTLSGLPEDPFLPQRIAARAAQSGKGVRMRNHKWMIVLAVVIVMSLTAAVASEMFSGTVDWDGNVVKDETEIVFPQNTLAPKSGERKAERRVLLSEFQDAHQAKEGEQVAIYDLMEADVPLIWDIPPRSVQNMEAFTEMMADAECLPLPVNIPEGYQFYSAYVDYGCKNDGEYRLVETVDSEEGFRAERYVLDEENAVATGYSLSLLKKTDIYDPANPQTWNMIDVNVSLASGVESSDVYICNGITVSAVNVPGMTKALAIRNERRNVMEMYRQLEQPVSYYHSNSFEATNSQIWVTIWSDATMEETIALFGGK